MTDYYSHDDALREARARLDARLERGTIWMVQPNRRQAADAKSLDEHDALDEDAALIESLERLIAKFERLTPAVAALERSLRPPLASSTKAAALIRAVELGRGMPANIEFGRPMPITSFR